MAGVSLGRVRDRARAAFWLVPAVCGIGAVGLAIGLGRLDRLIGDTEIVFLFPGPPEGARSFLGAIIGAMISFTGLVFSITVVVLVLTSGQFSPRVLRPVPAGPHHPVVTRDVRSHVPLRDDGHPRGARHQQRGCVRPAGLGHGGTVEDARTYAALVALDGERTMEQDVAFGFRQLVDIAERALSPSVNDPTTACQALDVMHDLLRRLVTREMPCGRHADDEGVVRLLVSRHDVGDFLRIALAEVWHYGSGSTQVPERLTVLLEDLADAARPEHRRPVLQWLDVVHKGTKPVPGRSA